jgi:hypothetical protein
LQWHPDKSKEEATHMFQRIGEAKDVLLDAQKRQEFDATFKPGADFNDVYETYEDPDSTRMRVALERFYRFYVECVVSEQLKRKSFTTMFTSCAIPAAIAWLRFQEKPLPVAEATLSAWITLIVFNPNGLKLVMDEMPEESRKALNLALLFLLKNDDSFA